MATTTAFVLSGGASLGSIQVGMTQALYAEGITPDLVVGSSAGAINGAWIAGNKSLDELEDVWHSLRRSTLFPINPLTILKGSLGRSPYVVSNQPLRSLLSEHLAFDLIEDAPKRFAVVATDVMASASVRLTSGPAVDAILASAAIPGVFPAVEINNRHLVDGGVLNNTPITEAISMGATEVWVLPTGYACHLQAPPTSALAMSIHGVNMLIHQRLLLEMETAAFSVPVHIIPTPCPISVSPIDFSQTEVLIKQARDTTAFWLSGERSSDVHALNAH